MNPFPFPATFLALFALLSFAPLVQAAKPAPETPSAVELLALPEYCRAKFSSNAAFHDQWRQRMTPEKFLHVHHYCSGLNFQTRARTTADAQLQRYYLERARGEFDYVLRNWPPAYSLNIEARNRRALVDSQLRR